MPRRARLRRPARVAEAPDRETPALDSLFGDWESERETALDPPEHAPPVNDGWLEGGHQLDQVSLWPSDGSSLSFAASEDLAGTTELSAAGSTTELDSPIRHRLEREFGADLSAVRLHTDATADGLARGMDALAFTAGSDIFFRDGAYAPSTGEGLHVLAHEVAHTVQQASGPVDGVPAGDGISVSEPSDPFERAADRVAEQVVSGPVTQSSVPSAALAGAPAVASVSSAPKASSGTVSIQRFEAQHHEGIERAALTSPGAGGAPGLSDAEASAAYFGNWSRDLNQAFSNNPVVKAIGNEMLFEILNVVAMQKFGHGLSPKDFGVYSPREHIDNPAGQVNSDLLTGDKRTVSQFGPDEQAQTPPEDISSGAVDKLFTVNDAGLPAYLGRSVQYVEEEFSHAADFGRTAEGLMHMGNGLHTCEDLFAHSNYIEIAIGQLYKDGALQLDADLKEELDQRTRPVDQGGEGLDAVETFTGKTTGGQPILTTGSFVSADTMISISEALTAFFTEFDPFAASNDARSQQTMELILGRYEETAKSGQASTIVHSFMHSFGSTLTSQLADAAKKAVAGEAPKENASLWDRAVSTVRGAAGAVVGGALSLAGSLMDTGWVQDMVGGAVSAFGSLPLTEIYRFAAKQRSSIEEFFKSIDRRLMTLPVYPTIRGFVLQQVDNLRELLKAPIQAAVRFVGQMVQKVFAEANVEGTNIEQQIKQRVSSDVKNPDASAELASATPERQMQLLADPNWCARARIAPEDLEHLRQMVNSPAWVRAGPSHSQIAKDHGDSPFFGAAATLAAHVDTEVRDKVIAVWAAEGHNTQADPKLRQNYADEIPPDVAARRAPPGTADHDLTDDQRRAEREAAKKSPHYKELRRREAGEQILREGGSDEAEEDHGAGDAYDGLVVVLRNLQNKLTELPATMRSLASRLQHAAPDAAAELRSLATELPRGLDNLAGDVESATTGAQMQGLADRLRALAAEKEGLVTRTQSVLRNAAGRAERADPALDDVAAGLNEAADTADWVMPRAAEVFRQLADALAERGAHQLRSDEQMKAVHSLDAVPTGDWDPELAKSHARAAPGAATMSAERAALFEYVRTQLFAHPWDVSWWRGPLTKWCNAPQNKERLEAYIRMRNKGGGEMHHHH
jgi:hypothetical protein